MIRTETIQVESVQRTLPSMGQDDTLASANLPGRPEPPAPQRSKAGLIAIVVLLAILAGGVAVSQVTVGGSSSATTPSADSGPSRDEQQGQKSESKTSEPPSKEIAAPAPQGGEATPSDSTKPTKVLEPTPLGGEEASGSKSTADPPTQAISPPAPSPRPAPRPSNPPKPAKSGVKTSAGVLRAEDF